MRREQVLKICANHFIQSTMDLNPMAGKDTAWIWHAMDASDEQSGIIENLLFITKSKNEPPFPCIIVGEYTLVLYVQSILHGCSTEFNFAKVQGQFENNIRH